MYRVTNSANAFSELLGIGSQEFMVGLAFTTYE
jgi:hypothetical protein